MPASPRRVRTAIVGLGFGAEFIPIHQRHPHAELVAICQRSKDKLDQVGKAHGVERRYQRYADVLKDSAVVARVIRSPFDTARQYRESFDVYGSKKSFEWQLCEGEEPVLHTAKVPEPEIPKRVTVPDYAHLLPEPIQPFTTGGVYDADDHQHLSFTQGGGHGGSHPHLVHEFVSALVEGRDPYPNARQSANWTCTGLLAHESAMKGGVIMKLPEWSFSS